MKVLQPSPFTNEWKKQVTCPSCEAVLEIELADLDITFYQGDFREPDSYGATITCPICKRSSTVVTGMKNAQLKFIYEQSGKPHRIDEFYNR